MLTDLDGAESPEFGSEDGGADDGVEVIEVGAGDDTWETTASLVGLQNRNPDVVAAAAALNQDGPEELAPKEAWIDPNGISQPTSPALASVCSPEAIARLSKPRNTDVTGAKLDFKPKLIGSKKKRAAAKGTGYGTRVIDKKPPAAPAALDFKPQLNFGSKASARRLASPGSQYGKAIPKPKAKKENKLDFTPKMDVSAKSTAIRNKAKSRAMDAAAKAAVEGKKVREATKAKQAAARDELGSGRHTLASDRGGATEEKKDITTMVFSPTPLHSIEVVAVHHTKRGNEAKAKAKSHYSAEHYRPKTGEKKALTPSTKGWAHSYQGPAADEVGDLPVAKPDRLLAKAKSHYTTGTYTPEKGEKPAPAVVEYSAVPDTWSRTEVHPSMIVGKTAAEIAAELPDKDSVKAPNNKQFKAVESSGYGVISPVPSIEAKVRAAQHRSPSSLMSSSDYKLKHQEAAAKAGMKKGGIAAAGAENVAPKAGKLSDDSSSLINALLHRAAALDDSVNLSKPPAAAAVGAAEEDDGETTAL